MHTYAFNLWAILTLASFQDMESQCSAVDLSPVFWSNRESLGSAHSRKSDVSADASFSSSSDFPPLIVWLVYQDASHEYVQLLRQSSTHSLQRMWSFSKSWCWNLPYECRVLREIIIRRTQTWFFSSTRTEKKDIENTYPLLRLHLLNKEEAERDHARGLYMFS